MNTQKVIIVMKHDLAFYPPIISLCIILRKLGIHVTYIGFCSSEKIKSQLEELDLRFYDSPQYGGGFIKRFISQLKFQRSTKQIIKTESTSKTVVWFAHFETVLLFLNLLKKMKCIVHFVEYRDLNFNFAYKILSGFKNVKSYIQSAEKVVCCERNRSLITKAVFELKDTPITLPNKTSLPSLENVSLKPEISELIKKYSNKKIILYQGSFNADRYLDCFCEAIKNFKNEEYVLFLMGNENNSYYQKLQKLYSSQKIVFLPFIEPPEYLLVTKEAYIGLLTYVPQNSEYHNILNVLYCAPNKIFEYSKFGKPMMSNELPALNTLFIENKAGETIDELTDEAIQNTILKIDQNYSSYKENSLLFYNSVNTTEIIQRIISNV